MEKIKINFIYFNIDIFISYTVFTKFFEKEQHFMTINKGIGRIFNLTGDMSDIISFPNALTEINWYRIPPPDIEFFGNFTIGLTYSLGLHSLEFTILNLSLGDYSYP